MRMLSVLSLLLIVIPQLSLSQSTSKQTNYDTRGIDSVVKNYMHSLGLVGIGTAIIIDKKLVWIKGYGYADKENKIPFTANTVMNIGSISKTFTGVCLMKAFEEKKLSLDEDINKYLPFKVVNPYFPTEKITLRNLATHTSSLVDRYPFYDSTYYYRSDPHESLGDFLKNYFVLGGKYYTPDNFLKAKPGTHREYSNIAAGLAGYIVEIRTGKKLSEYGYQTIFKPLKMQNTVWTLAEANLSTHSKLYDKQTDRLKQIPLYTVTTYPDGGIRTSVAELSKFFISLLNEGEYNGTRILKNETVDEMLRFHFTESNKPENVKPDKLNSGIFWATKMGATRIGHNGSDPGVRTFMLSDLNKEIGVILFVNTSLGEKEEGKYFDIYNELYKYGEKLKNKNSH